MHFAIFSFAILDGGEIQAESQILLSWQQNSASG